MTGAFSHVKIVDMFTRSLQNDRPIFHPSAPPEEPKTGSWCARNQKTFYDIFSVIVFPVGLIRCGNYLVGRCILPLAILPSTVITSLSATFTSAVKLYRYVISFFKAVSEEEPKIDSITKLNLDYPLILGTSFTYVTKDGVAIDAFKAEHVDQKKIQYPQRRNGL